MDNKHNQYIVSLLVLVVFSVVIYANSPFFSAGSGDKQLAAVQSSVSSLSPQSALKQAEQTKFSTDMQRIYDINKSLTAAGGRTQKVSGATDSAALERKARIKDLMMNHPRAFFAVKISDADRAKLSASVQANVEKKVTVEGNLEVLHLDDFKDHEKSYFKYYLKTKNDRLELYPTEPMESNAGAKIRLTGYQLDSMVAYDSGTRNLQVVSKASSLPVLGDQKTLVFLVKFLNSGPDPLIRSQVNDLVFNSHIQDYYKEQSYNQVSLSGDTYGSGDGYSWITLPRYSPYSVCESVSENDLSSVIQSNSIDLSRYDRIVYIVSHPFDYNGCSYVGKMTFIYNGSLYTASRSWVGMNQSSFYQYGQPGTSPWSWRLIDTVFSHELGHGLGLRHSNFWDCGDQAFGGNCQNVEYGNNFDVMGYGEFAKHFNVAYKYQLGWLDSSRLLKITSSGTYTISNLESNTGIIGAKISNPHVDQTPYFVERRLGIGFDSTLNMPEISSNQQGLSVNVLAPDSVTARLLDMSPTNLLWPDDIRSATLNGPNTFSDPQRGVKIGPIRSVNSSGITFDVTMTDSPPVCVRSAPAVSYSPSALSVDSGGTFYVEFAITNKDSAICNTSSFGLSAGLPIGWNVIYEGPNITLAPGATGYIVLSIQVQSSVPIGTYNTNYLVYNTDSSLAKTTDIDVNVRSPVPVCVRSTPAVSYTLSAMPVNPGGIYYAEFAITNKDSAICAPSSFTMYPNLPGGMSVIYQGSDVTLAPGAVGYIVLTVQVPSYITPGTYGTSYSVYNTDINWFSTTDIDISVGSLVSCSRNSPSVAYSGPNPIQVLAGNNIYFTLSVTNRDTPNCPWSFFGATIADVPAGWIVGMGQQISLAPNQTGTIDITSTVPSSANPAVYSTNYTITNLNSALAATQNISVTVSRPPNVASLTNRWNFDEGSGTTVSDSVSVGNPVATLMNGPTWTSGHAGQALNFDGLNDYVRVDDFRNISKTTPFSISEWIKLDTSDPTDTRTLISKMNSAQGYAGLEISILGGSTNNPVEFALYGTSQYLIKQSNQTWTSGQWTHIVVTYDGSGTASGFQLYRDGVLQNSTTYRNDLTSQDISNTAPLRIGMFESNIGPFKGSIDDVRIYSGVLSSAEVSAIYSEPPPAPPTTAPVGRRPFTPVSPPIISLVSTPTLSKTFISDGPNGNSTSTFVASFNVQVYASADEITLGLPSSSWPAFGLAPDFVQLYKNGASYSNPPDTAVAYSIPTGTTVSLDGNSFTIPANNSVTIPVTYLFSIPNTGSDVFSLLMSGMGWSTPRLSNQIMPTKILPTDPDWKTPSLGLRASDKNTASIWDALRTIFYKGK